MVFRSGVPSVFVPHAVFDVHYWALLAEELGCAPAAIPFPELTAERLANAISKILTTPRFRKTAAELGERVRQEQGVKQARLLIERLVHEVGLHKVEANRRLMRQEQARGERVNNRKQTQQHLRARRAKGRESIQ